MPTAPPILDALAFDADLRHELADLLLALLAAEIPAASLPPPGGITVTADDAKRIRRRAAEEAVRNWTRARLSALANPQPRTGGHSL